MSPRRRLSNQVLLITGVTFVALAGLALFAGCRKEQPPAQKKAQSMEQMPMREHAAVDQSKMDQSKTDTVAIEQKTCPVMEGNPINKDIFVEYQGKKVYFCCKACPEKFLANPEKYLAKLPQFQH